MSIKDQNLWDLRIIKNNASLKLHGDSDCLFE